MKNNSRIIILKTILILFFLIAETYAIEEFNFDVTEIEVTDNGNKFKGLKRGLATSYDGLIIEADIFEYDKITNILNAYGNVEIKDPVNDYNIFSNDITYEKNKELVFSKGETKAIIESKYNFLSKNVTLLRNKGELYSEEFSTVKDDKLTQYNLKSFRYYIEDKILKGNDVEVISDYTKNSGDRDVYIYNDGIFDLDLKNFKASETKIFLKKNKFWKKRVISFSNYITKKNWNGK